MTGLGEMDKAPCEGSPAVQSRRWYGSLLNPCPDYDPVSCGACALVQVSPCIAYGLNMKVALRSSPVCWAVFFVMFGGCSIWGLYSYISGITCYNEFIPPDFPNNTIIECFVNPFLLLVFVSAVAPLVLFVGVGACYAGRRRTLMRKRFQIPGSSAGDCCTWFWCGPCALSQETRTLWHNNVKEGVWHGPVCTPSAICEYTPPEIVELKQAQHDDTV